MAAVRKGPESNPTPDIAFALGFTAQGSHFCCLLYLARARPGLSLPQARGPKDRDPFFDVGANEIGEFWSVDLADEVLVLACLAPDLRIWKPGNWGDRRGELGEEGTVEVCSITRGTHTIA